MADNETIADIIAAKRRLAAEMEKALGDQHASVEMLKDDADRIEAAHKRELSKNVSKNGADFGQLGGAAKLREAVDAIISGYEKSDLCDMNYGEWCHDSANICVNVPLCKAIHEARTALAAPARNCDKYATVKEATEAFARERQDMPHPCPDFTFSRWLLTPVKKEGGAK